MTGKKVHPKVRRAAKKNHKQKLLKEQTPFDGYRYLLVKEGLHKANEYRRDATLLRKLAALVETQFGNVDVAQRLIMLSMEMERWKEAEKILRKAGFYRA
jgi:hypothetical protein